MDDLPHIPHMPRADSITESVLHFLAREAQVALRWTVIALMLITVVTMALFNFWGIIPATLLLVSYGLLMLANAAEKRSAERRRRTSTSGRILSPKDDSTQREGPAEASPIPDAPEEYAQDMPMPLLKHETIMISLGVLVVLLIAAVLAITAFDWQKVLIAIPFIGAYIILLSSPAWFAALEDDIEHETQGPGGT